MNRIPELIAPAGNMDCARAAVANGANAVYFGLQDFNARMRADNFTTENLPDLVAFLHAHRVRAFCTLNTLAFTDELPAVEQVLLALDAAGVDAVMVQDLGVARLAQQLGLRLEVHGSTQMTISSPEGVKFVSRLGIQRVVLARETSLPELAKFRGSDLQSRPVGVENPSHGVELEMFVHGALCIAYSGQCLTSEALGQRSANRGVCAQACRLPYELIVDGIVKELGDRRYLLSPQDLSGVREIPELLQRGVTGFKIEGRLKTPEYVAATCQVYRKALDAAVAITEEDTYKLEMTFSRGLYSGWLHGVNHQQLVHGRFGTKRGPFAGFVTAVGHDHVVVALECPVQPGDGVVFDTGGDTDKEQGGRVWEVRDGGLYFEHGHIDFSQLKPGHRVWKTSDPKLERELKRTHQNQIRLPKTTIDLLVTGAVGKPLTLSCGAVRVSSRMPLGTAYKRPLTAKLLEDQLGRLGETDYVLGNVTNKLVGQVILPVSELNHLRRELVVALEAARVKAAASAPVAVVPENKLTGLLDGIRQRREPVPVTAPRQLIALCRTMEQITVALAAGCDAVEVDFEDIGRYGAAVALVRQAGKVPVFLATPRIQKAGEQGFFKRIADAQPDGVLIRNLGGLDFFRASPLRKIGDFSLNVANPVTADLLMNEGLERVTISYDLNAQQVLDLLRAAPPGWFELVIHQHMPMFHMEHCVFAAFLTAGTDHTNCGRPCDTRNLKLRDRVGMEHPVKADVGCRNTVYHGKAQSGADYLPAFLDAGARVFRVELLEEDAARTQTILQAYRELIAGTVTDTTNLMRHLNAVKQLGVTSGTLTVLG